MSILDFVGGLQIVEWDVLQTPDDSYEVYYPIGVLDANPNPPPAPGFRRYKSPEPIMLTLRKVKDGVYELVLDAPQGREWEDAVRWLIYLQYPPKSDGLIGKSDEYATYGSEGSLGNGSIQFSFVLQLVRGDPSSTILIGHVRV